MQHTLNSMCMAVFFFSLFLWWLIHKVPQLAAVTREVAFFFTEADSSCPGEV